MKNLTGIILKSLSGFYYVNVNGKNYECKARGSFRKNGNSPVVGDNVEISIQNEGYSAIESILPRRNMFVRPPLANIDILAIVCSTVDPSPNYTIIDKMITASINNNIKPIIIVSKNDLINGENIAKIYKNAKLDVFLVSKENKDDIVVLKEFLQGKITAFTGNSGVGKSTLLNNLFPTLNLQTGEISNKLGRGKHTTRTVELFNIDGCYVADTPGFSTVDLQRYEIIDKIDLQYCFPEFEEYLGLCKFNSCSHTCEKGCRIIQAVNEGKIEPSRHKSYVQMYNEIKDIKSWQIKE